MVLPDPLPSLDEALVIIGATGIKIPKSRASQASQTKYGGGGGDGGGGPSRYESGWTRELSEAEYTQRVEAARKSAEARTKAEQAQHQQAIEGMGPLQKARYAARLEMAARDKLDELQRRFDATDDPKQRAAIQGQMDAIEASLALADQWIEDQEDEDREAQARELEAAMRAAERESRQLDREARFARRELERDIKSRAGEIRRKAEVLERQARALADQAKQKLRDSAAMTNPIDQIMARNEAAQLGRQADDLVKRRDKTVRTSARELERYTRTRQRDYMGVLRDLERRRIQTAQRIEQLRRRHARRLEQYSEAKEWLQRSREKERSSTTYFF